MTKTIIPVLIYGDRFSSSYTRSAASGGQPTVTLGRTNRPLANSYIADGRLYLAHICRGGPFLSLDDVEFDPVAFRQEFKAFALNSRMMNENIRAIIPG